MQLLRKRGHDLVLLHVMDDDELDFPFEGPTRFEGLELPDSVACNPRSLRAGYLAAVEAFLADVRTRAAAVRCDYSLVRTGEPVDAALVKFLSRRASVAV
jgi:glycine/D-amino acid oxidase-like deaminating enzyme